MMPKEDGFSGSQGNKMLNLHVYQDSTLKAPVPSRWPDQTRVIYSTLEPFYPFTVFEWVRVPFVRPEI